MKQKKMKTSFEKLINGDKPVLIDFFATWCGPCKALAPTLNQVVKEIGEKVRVVKIDVDKNQPLAQSLQVRGVPTLIMYKKGEVMWRASGALSKHDILTKINEHLS
jgi:thioredoxin 1